MIRTRVHRAQTERLATMGPMLTFNSFVGTAYSDSRGLHFGVTDQTPRWGTYCKGEKGENYETWFWRVACGGQCLSRLALFQY